MVKDLLLFYEKMMFFSGIAYGEYAKVGRFINDTLLIVTALAVRGYKPSKYKIVGFYILIMVVTIILGIIISALNIPQYTATLSNEQNPQFQQILNDLNLLKEKK